MTGEDWTGLVGMGSFGLAVKGSGVQIPSAPRIMPGHGPVCLIMGFTDSGPCPLSVHYRPIIEANHDAQIAARTLRSATVCTAAEAMFSYATTARVTLKVFSTRAGIQTTRSSRRSISTGSSTLRTPSALSAPKTSKMSCGQSFVA